MILNIILFYKSNFELFKGNWTIFLEKKDNHIYDSAKINIFLYPIEIYNGIQLIKSEIIFENSTKFRFDKNLFEFVGFKNSKNNTLFLFNLSPTVNFPLSKVGEILDDLFKTYNIQEPYDYLLIHKLIQGIFKHFVNLIEITSFLLNLNITNNYKPFQPGIELSGSLISSKLNLTIFTQFFDYKKFLSEGKIFGLFYSIILILNFYSWKNISKLFLTPTSLSKLSIHSFISIMSFDFVFSLYIFDFSSISPDFHSLFLFLFFCSIIIYFEIQIKFLVIIWKEQTLLIENLTEDYLRNTSLIFFFEVALMMILSSISFSSIKNYPTFSIIFLFSSFLPQIIHSAKRFEYKKNDSIFITFVGLNRILILFYFNFYKNNIEEIFNYFYILLIIFYILFQIIIILLQNYFGGAFFLPSKFKPKVYNYNELPVENGTICSICMTEIIDNERSMITPCNHAFHYECLTRWMNEQMICPICRNNLPPLSSNFLL